MLAYELTTLLASQQNLAHYIRNAGQFHPETGKGATNGVVALRQDRLFFAGEPYQIQIACERGETHDYICIQTSRIETAAQIAAAMQKVLGIMDGNVRIVDNKVTIQMAPRDLIARLRQRAICYEGINVFTEDGRLLLADRKGRGLASAGGHHSNKYGAKDIAYGLRSEMAHYQMGYWVC